MNNQNLYSLLEANSKLAREKKELIRLIRILNKTITELSVAAELYGEGMAIEADKYKSIPKGFINAMMENRKMVEDVTKMSKQSVATVEKSMVERSGGVDDQLMGNAYFESLIEEMNRLKNNSIKNNYMNQLWFEGYMGADGNWKFKKVNKNPKDINKAFGDDLNKYLTDAINQMFNQMDNKPDDEPHRDDRDYYLEEPDEG